MGRPSRIIIIGSVASGKSRASRIISKELGIPVYHIDIVFYEKAWTFLKPELLKATHFKILSEPTWIIEGNPFLKSEDANYTLLNDLFCERCRAADLILLIDTPPLKAAFWLLVRYIKHFFVSRPDIRDDCTNDWNLGLNRRIFNFRRLHLPHLKTLMKLSNSETKLYRIRSNRDLKKLLESVKTSTPKNQASN